MCDVASLTDTRPELVRSGSPHANEGGGPSDRKQEDLDCDPRTARERHPREMYREARSPDSCDQTKQRTQLEYDGSGRPAAVSQVEQ